MRRRTLAGVAIERGGFRAASRVLSFAMEWGIVVQELKRRPTVEEFAEFWKVSNATAYRDQARWREVFPEFDTPSDAWAVLGIDLTSDQVPSVYSLTLPKGVLDA